MATKKYEEFMRNKSITLLLITCFLLVFMPAYAQGQTLGYKALDLLKKRSYVELDSLLEELQTALERDLGKDFVYRTTWDAFDRPNPAFERLLNEWISSRPQSPYGYLARATYYHASGWKSRGTKWAHETSADQFSQMEHFFQKAILDLDKADALKPGMLLSSTIRIDIAKATSDPSIKKLYYTALAKYPLSFLLRQAYANTLLPRWGGSFEEMSQLIEETRPYYSKNQQLRAVESILLIELGDREFSNHNYKKALNYYNEAITLGESPEQYYVKRGKTLFQLELYPSALNNFSRALSINSFNHDAIKWVFTLELYMSDWTVAIDGAKRYLEIDPDHDYAYHALGISYHELCNYDNALENEQIALTLKPQEELYLRHYRTIKKSIDDKRRCDESGNNWVCKQKKCIGKEK
ncbi:MAG: DUF4034 domain-containing protein [Nitrospiraceae bacterium]|nr:MAG: DUF4034 domain-containing protein [Nitrospiraceae bacterium]